MESVSGFIKTVLNEFYRITFRKKLYKTIEELQAALDQWLKQYNEERTHQGVGVTAKRRCKLSSTVSHWPKRRCWQRECKRISEILKRRAAHYYWGHVQVPSYCLRLIQSSVSRYC